MGMGMGVVAASAGGGIKVSKWMELRWVSRNPKKYDGSRSSSRIPIHISTNPSHIKPHQLRDLYTSCHRHPNVFQDIDKLRTALSHSSILVSVFSTIPPEQHQTQTMGLGDLLHTLMPVSPSNAQLVGFGRAVSDCGLTASIHDVMVIPSLRRMGIGRMIVKRIVRMLTNRDIYDIAALCSENQRLFFEACGFGDDILGSITMMYTRTVSTYPEEDQQVKRAGRKLLLVPQLREPFASSKAVKS